MMTVLFVVGWIACGIAAAGTLFAMFQGQFPSIAKEMKRQNLGAALLLGLACGPISLVVSIFASGFWEYGWWLW